MSDDLNITLDNYFGYDPNQPLAAVGACYFGIMFSVVLGLNIYCKQLYFPYILLGSAMETIGYATRPFALTNLGLFVTAQLMVILAPTIYAMADYAFIGAIMHDTNIRPLGLSPRVLRLGFMVADWSAFLIQAGGGGSTSSQDNATRMAGARALFAGLCCIETVFVMFLFLNLYVHRQLIETRQLSLKWRRVSFLYFDVLLLILRSGYRIAEYSHLEYYNPISLNETLFYVLDTLPMSILNFIWIPFHPFFISSAASPTAKAEAAAAAGGRDMEDTGTSEAPAVALDDSLRVSTST